MFHGYVKLPEGQIILAPPAELDGLFANLPQPDPFRLRFCLFRRFPKSWRYPQSSQSDHDLVETTMVQWLGIPHDLRTPTVALVAGWCRARFEVTSENDLFSFHPQRGREQFPRDAGAGAAGLIWGMGGVS